MFNKFDLHERLLKAVEKMGLQEPTPVQERAIPMAMQAQDLWVTAQTGSGKTAAFVLPMLNALLQDTKPHSATRVLILLPTRELAQQTLAQVKQFSQFTFIKSVLVTGGEALQNQAAAIRKNPEIVLGTPGRLLELLRAGHLHLGDLEILILDEADRMLDLGFDDDVQALTSACHDQRQTLLFSATSGGKALSRVVEQIMVDARRLAIDPARTVNHSIQQQIITADNIAHKERLLQWLLTHENYNKTIVFTNTRAQADRLGSVLRAAKFMLHVLHGEKKHDIRKQVIAGFHQGHFSILVATDVAARGLDIEGMDLVINFDMPRSGDEYIHRIGRTGRINVDGVPAGGMAVSMILTQEWNLMASIERYLKLHFTRRTIKELKGAYQGPKKLKASGKAAGKKKKVSKSRNRTSKSSANVASSNTDNKTKKKATKRTSASSKPVGKKSAGPATNNGSRDGFSPLKRKPKS